MTEFEERFGKTPVFLVKFADEEWKLEELAKGILYLSTVKYFQDLEKEGMGDNYDCKEVLTETDIQMYTDNTKKHLVYAGKGEATITDIEDCKRHIFCTTCIEFKDLNITKESENYFKVSLFYTDEQKKKMKENFGEYALIIKFKKFIDRIETVFNRENIIGAMGKANYVDYSKNRIDRITSFLENTPDKFFWKRLKYKYQNEFRIAVLNRTSNDAIKIDIGDISEFTELLPVDELCEFSTGMV